MCGSLPTTAFSSASISFRDRPSRERFRPVMKISWFRPIFIEHRVVVAASIFSGVALATTIEFAVNFGTTGMAVLSNITGSKGHSVEPSFLLLSRVRGRKLVQLVSPFPLSLPGRQLFVTTLPRLNKAKVEVVEVVEAIPKNIKP